MVFVTVYSVQRKIRSGRIIAVFRNAKPTNEILNTPSFSEAAKP